MALIKKVELDNGIKLSASYHKIGSLSCTHDTLDFYVEVYKDKESRLSNKKPVEYKNYICAHDVSNNSVNSIRQAYNYLKKLPEYQCSSDDLEF